MTDHTDGDSDSEASTQQHLHTDIARIGAVLAEHPELIPSTQSFLGTMLAPEEEG
jgi:hypothetical protein